MNIMHSWHTSSGTHGKRPANRRGGFTLVEMLVVIAIIAVLAAIAIPTIYLAVGRAKENRIIQEISQLDMAIEAYKQKFGYYPPDFSDIEVVSGTTTSNDVVRHMMTAFNNNQDVFANNNITLPNGAPALDTSGNKADVANLDPSEAIVFWLGMVKNDARQPLNGQGEPNSFFDFDEERLIDLDGDGWPSYVPKVASDYRTPYVYFNNRTYNRVDASGSATCRFANPDLATDVARPYQTLQPNQSPTANLAPNFQWAERQKYQIISAGLDGVYGSDLNPFSIKQFKNAATYTLGDYDNITNFSQGTFEDNLE